MREVRAHPNERIINVNVIKALLENEFTDCSRDSYSGKGGLSRAERIFALLTESISRLFYVP